MRYRDFSILLEPEGGRFLARVVDSPAGSTRAYVDLAGCVGSSSLFDSESERRALGSALFDRLFVDQIRGCWDQSVGQVAAEESTAIRLRIHFNLDEPGGLALHGLPWECLYSSVRRSYLSLSRRTSIVRDVSLPIPSLRFPLEPPLRVLLVGASPHDLKPLKVVSEGMSIARAIRETDQIRASPLKRADLESLRQQLLEDEIHILHFMVHSALSPRSGEGLVFLQDQDGASVAVSGTQLANHLRDCQSLRLVLLNSCRSACLSPEGPYLGLASAILHAEVPAVIAMQSPVSDPAAMAFSRTFYRRLAAGDPIDAAMTEGRLAIQREPDCEREWSTPALFLRSPDGQLFAPARAAPAPPATRPLVASPAQVAALTPTNLQREREPRIRPWRSLAAWAAGAAAVALGFYRWTGSQEARTEPPPSLQAQKGQDMASGPQIRSEPKGAESLGFASAIPLEATPKERKGAVTAGLTERAPATLERREVPEEAAGSIEAVKAAPESPPPDFYWLGEFDSATWAQQGAQLSARFSEVAGMGLVEVSVSPKGSPTIRLPFTTAESASREGTGGTYRVEVLQIDWPRKRVKVRPIFQPS